MVVLKDFLKKHWPWLSLATVFWYFSLPAIRAELLDFGGDSAQYIILAENLSKGLGYHLTNYPGDPFCFLYPPVFPGILSLVAALFGRDLYLMSLLISLLGFGGVLLTYRLLKKYASKSIAYLSALSLAVSADYIVYSAKLIRSEIPYIFFSCAALLALTSYLKEESWQSRKGWLAAGLLVLAYFTRYFGITLFAGALISLAASRTAQKAKKILLIALVFLTPFTAWQTAKFFYHGQKISQLSVLASADIYNPAAGTLFQHPGALLGRFINGLDYYSAILALSVVAYTGPVHNPFSAIIAIAVFSIIVGGAFVCFRKDKSCVFGYYVLLSFFMALAWPAKEGVRLIIPILAFLLFYFWVGLQALCARSAAQIGKAVFVGAACVILGTNVNYSYRFIRLTPSAPDKTQADYRAVHGWIKRNLDPGGLIMSRRPTITAYYTGHQAIVYAFSPNPDDIRSQVEKNMVKYIVSDGMSREEQRYLAPFVAKYADRLKLRYAAGNCAVFEVL